MNARILPGDVSAQTSIERMIRVDQAGEYGAVRIYKGQLAVLKNNATIAHMAQQEKRHLDTFNTLVAKRKIRPTALQPLWHIGGWLMGAGSALLGEKAAMACTVAVESVIDEHYRAQEERLDQTEGALRETIREFRAEEMQHHDTALAHGAEESPFYAVLTTVIKAQTKLAIWLSERI